MSLTLKEKLGEVITVGIDVKSFGATGDGVTDDTVALNAAVTSLKSKGKEVFIPAGTYRITGTIDIANITVTCEPGTIFEHYPPNDSMPCLQITGADMGRSVVRGGLTIKGLQNGHQFGQDGVRVRKGDYVEISDITVISPKRHGFRFTPSSSFFWIENFTLDNCKVQDAGVDAYNFSLVSGLSTTFINQGNVNNCESRGAKRRALTIQNDNSQSTAAKISNVKFDNCELAGAANTNGSSTVNVSGTTVSWVNGGGDKFDSCWQVVFIGGTMYTVSSVPNDTTINLTASPGTMTGVAMRAYTYGGEGKVNVGGSGNKTVTWVSGRTFDSQTRIITIANVDYYVASVSADGKTITLLVGPASPLTNADYVIGADPIVMIQGPQSGGVIEDIKFEGCAIEMTDQVRDNGMLIANRMQGYFEVTNTILFGVRKTRFEGVTNFSRYDVDDQQSGTIMAKWMSHQGVSDFFRSDVATAAATTQATGKTIGLGGIYHIYVMDRLNQKLVSGAWAVINQETYPMGTPKNVTLTIDSGTGEISLTNNHTSSVQFEMYLQRITTATNF